MPQQDLRRDLISQLREQFLKEVQHNIDEYCNEDIEKVRTQDLYCQRFLSAAKENVNAALNKLITALKWRKSFGVRDIKASEFALEWHNSIFIGKARDGSTLLVIPVKFHHQSKEWNELFTKYIAYMFEYLENNNVDNKGVTALLDFTDASIANADLSMFKTLLGFMGDYYPKLIIRDILCETPWFLSGIVKIFISLLPYERRKNLICIPKSQLIDYIEEEYIPNFLGGHHSKTRPHIPAEQMKPFDEWVKTLDMSDKSIAKMGQHLKFVMEEVNKYNDKDSL